MIPLIDREYLKDLFKEVKKTYHNLYKECDELQLEFKEGKVVFTGYKKEKVIELQTISSYVASELLKNILIILKK